MKGRENKLTFHFWRKFYTHPSTRQYLDYSISQGGLIHDRSMSHGYFGLEVTGSVSVQSK